jgi:hypothetical protein
MLIAYKLIFINIIVCELHVYMVLVKLSFSSPWYLDLNSKTCCLCRFVHANKSLGLC